MAIQFFSKGPEQYQFLSNFYRAPFAYDKQWWPTAEHLYQAMKFPKLGNVRDHIRQLPTPQEAKAFANANMQHVDEAAWEVTNVAIMRMITVLKFSQNPDLLKALLATGKEDLIHYCPWGDTFWGVDRHMVGQNMQGKILMEVRAQMRAWE